MPSGGYFFNVLMISKKTTSKRTVKTHSAILITSFPHKAAIRFFHRNANNIGSEANRLPSAIACPNYITSDIWGFSDYFNLAIFL